MSADFKTCLIKDSRLGDITDQQDYAVVSGGSSVTYQQFQAVSTSASSIVFNVNIPSESVVVSREVLIKGTINFQIAISGVDAGDQAFNYGVTDSLQAFPLNKLFTTATSTINNTNVSINEQDILDLLLRFNNNRELYRYNGMTPALPDQAYQSYADGLGTINNPLSSWKDQSYDGDLMPRGAYPLNSCVLERYTTAGGSTPVDNNPVAQGDAGENWIVTASVSVTEPLFLSPYIFGEPQYNAGGFAGINTMNFVFNIDSSCKRFFSTMSNATTYSVSLVSNNPFSNMQLSYCFLSTQPSDLIPVRNVVPYMDFPRYLSLSTNSVAIPVGSSQTINSQNIQLNQLPDYFVIAVRKPMSSQTPKDSASFLPINTISINLNNTSGLLSSAKAEELWRISVNNNSTQSWEEFSGKAYFSDSDTGCGSVVATTGSILVLSPPKDLSLPDFLSSGSIGQFNFQFSIDVTNNTADALQPEIVILCVNSGVFVTQMGSSNIYTGILTKQSVLDTKSQHQVSPVNTAVYSRMVGGKLGHLGMSMVKRMKLGKSAGASSGGAMSAGSMSAGASSSGARSRISKFCA
jgi:hypothetical protein